MKGALATFAATLMTLMVYCSSEDLSEALDKRSFSARLPPVALRGRYAPTGAPSNEATLKRESRDILEYPNMNHHQIVDQVKKSDTLLRFGRGRQSEEDEDELDVDELMAREARGGTLLRFGRAPLLRFGKRAAPLLRFGKRAPMLRFGKKEDTLLRFGRSARASRFERPDVTLRFG